MDESRPLEADRRGGTAEPAATRSPLYTPAFRYLCLTSFLGFSGQNLVQPVLPLLVIAFGGDAALGGLVIAVFSLPSVVLRPWVGRAADAWSRRGVLLVGVCGLTLSGLLYLVPSLVLVFLTRIGHGVAWAAFNTGAASVFAVLVPAGRRGEAAGIWSLIPGIASAVMPAVGLVLLATWGLRAPFLAAAALGAVAFVIALRIADDGPAGTPRGTAHGSLIDRRAVRPMAIELLWTMTQALFVTFPPLIARERGIALESLPAYYLIVGVVLVGSRLVASRVIDKVTWSHAIWAGVILGSVALVTGAVARDLVVLTLAGCIYAAGTAAVLPVSLAMVLDATSGERTGSAMATYSLGHQLGLGGGALAAGFLLEHVGADVAYLAALAAIAGVVAVVFRRPPPRIAAGGPGASA